MLGKVLLGGVGALISIGLAAPASADPVTTVGSVGAPQPDAVPSFLAAARAAGITGTDPAMLEDGYGVCRQLWNPQTPATQVAANLAAGQSPADQRPGGSIRAGRVPLLMPGARRVRLLGVQHQLNSGSLQHNRRHALEGPGRGQRQVLTARILFRSLAFSSAAQETARPMPGDTVGEYPAPPAC